MTLTALATAALAIIAQAPSTQPAASTSAPALETSAPDDWAAAKEAAPAPTSRPAETAEDDGEGTASTQPAAAEDDPFFDSDLDSAFETMDTEWQDEEEIAASTKVFVGPPSPYSLYKKLVKHDVISLLLRTRVLASVQEVRDTRDDGFELRQLRASVSGKLGDLSYFSQVEAAQSPALVDAYLAYRPLDAIGVAVGLMKTPFSREYLITRPDLSFIDRSEIVLATAPGRSTGAELIGDMFSQRLRYKLGLFNSRGMSELDWGRRLLYVGRVEGTPLRFAALGRSFAIDLGLSGGYGAYESLDFSANTQLAELGGFDGSRLLTGGDIHLQLGPAWITGEAVYGRYEASSGSGLDETWTAGGYAEIGTELVRKVVNVMVRYDGLYAAHRDHYNQFVIGGVRIDTSEFLRIQINYTWGTGGGHFWSRNQLIAGLQLTL